MIFVSSNMTIVINLVTDYLLRPPEIAYKLLISLGVVPLNKKMAEETE